MRAEAPTKLRLWREWHGLTPRHAARVLRISPDLYAQFERGEGECPASLAMEIAQRTHMCVLPGDLPGCAIETEASDILPGIVGPDATAGADAGSAPEPTEPGPGSRTAPPTGPAGREAGSDPVTASLPHVVVARMGDEAAYSVVLQVPADRRYLSWREAIALGLELTRAGLLAQSPGSIPV